MQLTLAIVTLVLGAAEFLSHADHNPLVMKHGLVPGLFWSGNDKLLLDCHACNSKDEIARTAQIGPIHIELRMP